MPLIGMRPLRRPFVWLLMVQQIVAGVGVSMPRPAAGAHSGERYPCEDCGCGCRSAQQCWAHCSCFTLQEKINWARRNGVAVPESFVVAAKRNAVTKLGPDRAPCHRQCASRVRGPCRDVCQRNRDERGGNKNRPSGGVSILSALRCHGLAQYWQAVTESWPGDAQVEPDSKLLPRGRVETPLPLRCPFFPLPPPTPPPNAA